MIDQIKRLVRAGRYRLTLHAEQERDADLIRIAEIEWAFSDQDVEIIEDYPDDPRGHSALVLGFTLGGKPLHAVWSIHENLAILITIYRPEPRLWTNWRIRKEKLR